MKTYLRWALLVAVLLAGCSGAGYRDLPAGYLRPEYYRDPERGAEQLHRVYGNFFFTNWLEWSNSPWHRIEDTPTGVWYVMTDAGGRGCIVPPDIWAMNPREIACPSGWRFARPTTRK